MNLESILALIGAVTVVLVVAINLFVGGFTLWCRLRSGSWWWEEEVSGQESGRG